MAVFINTFEGGANGSTITNENSGGGSGDSFQTSIGTNGSLTYASTAARRGNLGMKVETSATNVAVFVQGQISAADRTALRFYFMAPAVPSSVCSIAQIRTAAVAAIDLRFSTDGRLYLGNTSGAEINGTRAATALTPNIWYRIEMAARPGGTSTSGFADFAYYLGDSMVAEHTVSVSGVNMGAAQTQYFRLGRPNATTFIGSFYFDDAKTQDISSGYVGPELSYPNYGMVWDGSGWIPCRESDLIWSGTSWS